MIILGIDPGSHLVGYGVLEKENKEIRYVAHGSISIKEKDDGLRLVILKKELDRIIEKYKPQIAGVEKIFFFKNQKTIIGVAQSRGIILHSLAQKNIKIFEFTPLEVKGSVSSYGRTDKKGVQKMVKLILSLKEIPEPDDASDALAIAICCANGVDTM